MSIPPECTGACSSGNPVDQANVEAFIATLERDLASGASDARYGYWRTTPTYDRFLRLEVRRWGD